MMGKGLGNPTRHIGLSEALPATGLKTPLLGFHGVDCGRGKLSDSPAANWRFGDKQTPEQEQAEIKRARRDGL